MTTDFKPMLAQSVHPDELVKLANDPSYYFQQKLDGKRVMVVSNDRDVSILNRNGERSSTELSASIRSDLGRLPAGLWVLDGELVDGTLWLFDLPHGEELAHPGMSFSSREFVLQRLMQVWKPSNDIRALPTACDTNAKLRLSHAVLRYGGEGLIAKTCSGKYHAGARSHTMLKVKFFKDIDCVVTDLKRDGKQNIGLAVYDNGTPVDIGEVTALAGDGPGVKVGDVVTVKFLYAVDPHRPRLYQPTLPQLRDDKPADQCTIDQLDNAYRNLNVLTDW